MGYALDAALRTRFTRYRAGRGGQLAQDCSGWGRANGANACQRRWSTTTHGMGAFQAGSKSWCASAEHRQGNCCQRMWRSARDLAGGARRAGAAGDGTQRPIRGRSASSVIRTDLEVACCRCATPRFHPKTADARRDRMAGSSEHRSLSASENGLRGPLRRPRTRRAGARVRTRRSGRLSLQRQLLEAVDGRRKAKCLEHHERADVRFADRWLVVSTRRTRRTRGNALRSGAAVSMASDTETGSVFSALRFQR